MKRDNTIDINQYTKKKHIGSGNFGDVYTVRDNKTNKILAAKIFKEEINKSSDKTVLKNLKREVSIISRVRHPSIIQFIGLSMKDFDNNDKPVIITNYIPNGSLKNLLDLSEKSCASKRYNDTKKLITIYGIAASMEFLHSHQILHRDLKPDNILMDSSYYPILADFGISKDQNILEKSFAGIKGTPIYLSPEIWEDFYYSKASDVYAFSLIVYEIIANEKPFKNCKNIYTLQQQVMNGNRPDASYIDEPYKNLIESCWAQDFEDRPTFEDIVQELKENPNFITDSIDEDEYRSYIEYIDESPKDFISIINPKYKKNIDIVYLIDGSKSSEVLLTAVNDTFESISYFCKSKFPSIYFRFGFVIYYDLIFTQKSHKKNKRYPILLDLTDDIEDIKNFLYKSESKGIGGFYPNDLASGFNAIYDRISWEKNSEKIIIHICNSPTFGKYFTMDPEKNNNDKKNDEPFIKIPYFKENVKYQINFDIFKEVQKKQTNWLILNIRRLANNGIKMYCLNTNKLALYSCYKVSEKFIEVGGQKYVIQNLFDQDPNSDMFDIDKLNTDFEQFVKNVVDSSTKSDAETPFEIKCKKEFDKDFSAFFEIKKNDNQVDKLMLRIAELEKQISIDKEEIKEFKKEKKAFQNQIQELEEEKHSIEQNELLKDRSLNIKIDKIIKENAELSKKLEKVENDNVQLKNENMKLMNEVEIKNREFQIQRQKWLKERSVLDTKYNELLASYKEEKNRQITRTNPPQLSINTDQLINENQKLSDANKLLVKKYNDLYAKNHHNYVLIGDMKKLIIEMGNLDQNEKKLGSIDMIKVAFAKKNKIINDLKNKK